MHVATLSVIHTVCSTMAHFVGCWTACYQLSRKKFGALGNISVLHLHAECDTPRKMLELDFIFSLSDWRNSSMCFPICSNTEAILLQ